MSTGDPDPLTGAGNLSQLQESLNKQQEKISALKELVRKSEAAHGKSTTTAQEKVKNIAQRLTNIKSKARSRQNLDSTISDLKDEPIFEESQTSSPAPSHQRRPETPGSEKIQFLRKQVEESKMKMAEREHSKREIEERVTQLKAKFDSTQQSLERSSELGRSMGDLSILSPGSTKEKFKSAADLSFVPLNLDKEKIKFLENRVKLLEKQIEKQGTTSSIAESDVVVSLKNRILDLEENLREKECVILARTQAASLISESLSAKTATTVDTLEDMRVEMQKMQGTFIESENSLNEQIRQLQNELVEKNHKIRNLEEVNDILETSRFELTVKNADLESKLLEVHEYNTKIDELNKMNEVLQQKVNKLEEQLAEKTVECNVLNANFSVLQEKLKSVAPKSLFSKSPDEETEIEMKKLKDQLDEANKSMIKIKLKSKQLQKQVDKFKKVSDTSSELIKLTEENQELQMRIAELEEEKGCLQLKLLGSGSEIEKPADGELEKKIKVLETTCQNQTSAIQLLEEQKLELQTTNQELEASIRVEQAHGVQVESQMESIHMEEQAENYEAQITELKTALEKLRQENENWRAEIRSIAMEKQDLQKKLDHYIAENIELLDKVEKLSKSSSSAESIEIVESLTHQEKLEMEEFSKQMSSERDQEDEKHLKATEEPSEHVMGEDLSDSLAKLREESSELMNRIELFTTERCEVLEKMETLTSENQNLKKQLQVVTEEKSLVEDSLTKTKLEIVSLEEKLDKALHDVSELKNELNESTELKAESIKEIQAISEVTKALKMDASCSKIVEQCATGVAQLQIELENYRKSNDKSSRLNASKKLAKEAKNVCEQYSSLIDKIDIQSSAEPVPRETAETNGLKEKCVELEKVIETLTKEIQIAKTNFNEREGDMEKIRSELGHKVETYEQDRLELEQLKQMRKELETKLRASENEIDILNTLVSEQKQQIIDSYAEHESELNEKLLKLDELDKLVENLQSELAQLRNASSRHQSDSETQLRNEIKKLENHLTSNEKLISEQLTELNNKQSTIETLNAQIIELYKTMEENTKKVFEKEDEIAYLQDLLEANKAESEVLAKENQENKNVIAKVLAELHVHKSYAENEELLKGIQEKNNQLEAAVSTLFKTNAELEAKNKEQMDKLKKFAANLKKKTAHCIELETKLKEIGDASAYHAIEPDHQNVLMALQAEIQHYKEEIDKIQGSNIIILDKLRQEIATAINERDLAIENSRSALVQNEKLEEEIHTYKTKVEYFERSVNEMTQLVGVLHNDINGKDDETQRLGRELETTQNYAKNLELQLVAVNDELKNKNLKFEKSKALIKERNREIQRLKSEIEELEKKSSEQGATETTKAENTSAEFVKLQQEYEKLVSTYAGERETFQETISRLEILYDGIQAKFQENMSYIESLETENNTYKEKNVKLENCIAIFEERRKSLEKQTNLLDAQLQKQTDEYERNEDALIYRLNMLLDHDDVIGKRLVETQEQKEELVDKVEQLCSELSDLQLKLSKTEIELDSFKNEKHKELKAQNESLQEKLDHTLAELARQQNIYEGRLSQKHAEIDELENDLSIQLSNMNQEKRKLQESLEKAQDEINELKDENVKLKETCNSLEQTKTDLEREITWIRMQNDNMTQDQYELQELRMQSLQDKTEIDNLKHQVDSLVQNHEIELSSLREQMKELDSVRMQVGQNQTDDQVFIENENKRLKEELAEKASAIENYQKENLKLQMASMTAILKTPSDPFQTSSHSTEMFNPDASHREIANLNAKTKMLEEELLRAQTVLTEKDRLYSEVLLDAQQTKEQLKKFQNESSKSERVQPTHGMEQSALPSMACFPSSSDAASVFDELITVQRFEPLGQAAVVLPDQQKIEDLQRNVSDLEKYANELESKLKNLTSIHEITAQQLQESLRKYDEAVKNYETQIKALEEKEQLKAVQENLESLIMAPEAPANKSVPSLNIFFDNPSKSIETEFDRLVQQSSDKPIDETDRIPVQEDIIVPKKAYLVYPETNEPITDEGWGWGSEEAVLEERHQQQLQSAHSNNAAKMSEYKDRIDALEIEKSRSDEKVVELQVKCGKLMKKLREYKSRIDQVESDLVFRKSTSVDSSDLDQAIQDELKLQISKLEGHISEMKKQYEKDLAEKENLMKRIDVLTMGNDRMTELKERQDIEVESLQMKVKQLTQKLQQLEDWNDRGEDSVQQLTSQNTCATLNVEQKELEAKLANSFKELEDLRIDRDELQALLDDERNNVAIGEKKLAELKARVDELENNSSNVESLKKEFEQQQDLLKKKEVELANTLVMNQNFQLQLNDYQSTMNQLSAESDKIREQLIKLQTEYSEKVRENAHLSDDLKLWMTKCEEFSKQLELLKVQSKANDENDSLEKRLIDLTSQLQYKEAEILHLQQKIQDLIQDEQTELLSQQLLDKTEEIMQLQTKFQQMELRQQELEAKLTESQSIESNLTNTDNTEDFQNKIKSLENQLEELKAEKQHTEAELQVLNEHVLSTIEQEDNMKKMTLDLQVKNAEIEDLRNTITSLQQQQHQQLSDSSLNAVEFENALKIKTDELNRSWEKTVEEKCSEIADRWRQYMDERETEFKNTQRNLNLEIEQLRAGIVVPKRKTSEDIELETSRNIDSDTVEKLKSVLEQQELEIVTLKEQLALRSAEYARLAARHDPYALSTTSNIAFESKAQRKLSTNSAVGEQPGVVPKSELDLALYMLHQRDMRCEELTLELVNLLEERDTLQLKLSNSLRQIEEAKQKTNYPESGSESDQLSSNANSPEKLSKGKSIITTESDHQSSNLSSKLSQLQTVGYAKDKRFREEREQRQRQMEKIQQDVANIPSEAVSELVGSDLANTIQSPSNVLLDWLWGRSNNSQQS